jgi:alpha-tubulin suppressor-like RCC1 family protein
MTAARHRRAAVSACALLVLAIGGALPAGAPAEQASQPSSRAAGALDAGGDHTCALLAGGLVRCWGYNAQGQLGYGNTSTIGVDQTPAAAGPVNLGRRRTAKAISAGDFHTCAILDDGNVLCWGYGADGRLGYGNTRNVGDRQPPGSVGPVDLGRGRTAKAISAGGAHTCAILDDGSVLCWGYGANGRLGYGHTSNVGDRQTPGSVGPVDLGPGRTARAISAGEGHTCAILDNGTLLCWGYAGDGRLGYENLNNDVGDDETPASAGPVDLGPGRTAVAISAGGSHTCAILDDGSVRCWGYGGNGRLGYANTDSVGGEQTPGSVGPVDLGPGRTAKAISAGGAHTCAILDDRSVLCWGYGADGRLGYAGTSDVGDDETPGSAGPVNLGPGRTATAISAGQSHTCARLDNAKVICWGYGANGRLGYCNQDNVGDDETPGSVGTVNLLPGDGGVRCTHPASAAGPLVSQARRAQGFRHCQARAARRPKRARAGARRACLRRYARTPGRIIGLRAQALPGRRVVLVWGAPGSDNRNPPAARAYLVEQSSHPIRGAREFTRAQTLCHGSCRFPVTAVGATIKLTITHLRPHTTYYYTVAALDNVTGRRGPDSRTVKIRTR